MPFKIFVTFCLFLVFVSNFNIVYATNEYKIADAASGSLETIIEFDDYYDALEYYNNNTDNYENLVLLDNLKIIKMEYGIVSFISENSKTNVEYVSDVNENSYINASFVADAAYISTSNNAKLVNFKLSGNIGTIYLDEVELIPYELIDVRLSQYSIISGKLHHDIKTNLNHNYYSSSIILDYKPEYLEEGASYYSYDGHYFYDDFKMMIDDYRNETSENALNKNYPYYNYYVFLPHRSYTNYNLKEVEDYFTNEMFLDGKIQFYDDLNLDNANDDVNLSQLYGEWKSFFGYEKIYGANAMMMISLACHESAYGKSLIAFSKNNLFGHAAYDSDAERSASRYSNIDASIYSHAKYYVSRSYAGVHSSLYHGSCFGDKSSGMNVMYSSDPYWGEKAAANYFRFDEALGLKDKDSYAIGIVNKVDSLNIYNNEDLSSLSFKLDSLSDYSLIILEDMEDSYKVQVDASYSDDYIYDPLKSVGYVDKDEIDFILNEDKIHEDLYVTYEFDLDEGTIADKEKIKINVKENVEPSITNPIKEGYEFIGFDEELSKDNLLYKAIYKKIDSIAVIKNINQTIEYDYFYNLKGGKLKVNYADGTEEVLDINSNMISAYDPSIEGNTNITISYNGVNQAYPVTFSKEINEYRDKLKVYIDSNINTYLNDKTYDLNELAYIKENLRKVDYLTTFNDIRYIDKMLLENTRDEVNYHFKESKYDVSISGLALSLKDPETISVFKPFKDTYFVETYDLSKEAHERLREVAEAYGFSEEDSLRVAVSYNLKRARFDNPIIIQLKIQDKKKDKIYTVYHLDDDGNVIKCMTTQTNNYVSFMTRSEGDFMILSMDSVNTYDIEDSYENMSKLNADPDNHSIFMAGIVIIAMGLLGFTMIIIYYLNSKKEEKLWNDYKKLLQEAESHQEEKLKN